MYPHVVASSTIASTAIHSPTTSQVTQTSPPPIHQSSNTDPTASHTVPPPATLAAIILSAILIFTMFGFIVAIVVARYHQCKRYVAITVRACMVI